MPLLSRKADYALVILSVLHHRPEGGSAREVAARFGLRPAFTAKVLKLLCRKGLVRSQRGVRGGYVLQRPAEKVCLCELLEALEEPFHLTDCNADPGACSYEGVCPVRGALAEVDRRIRDLLRTVTLASLFQPGGPACGLVEAGCTQFGLALAVPERAESVS